MIVAIDGPAGAGKSTVARRLAERLGFRYLDTGAMYRALTWLAMRESVDLSEGGKLGELAERYPVELDDQGRVFIAAVDVTAAIRRSEIDRLVPVVARHPQVRRVMRDRQRELAEQGNAVIEGRDIGTVVAPDAEVKIYLKADREIRARRRLAERPEIGADALNRQGSTSSSSTPKTSTTPTGYRSPAGKTSKRGARSRRPTSSSSESTTAPESRRTTRSSRRCPRARISR